MTEHIDDLNCECEECDIERIAIIRAKWTIDDAKTLSEAAEKLRSFANYLEKIETDGWQLTETINDDYGFLRHSDKTKRLSHEAQ